MSRVFESCIKLLSQGCLDCVFNGECAEKQLYEQGRADERKEWELSAGELLVKYAGDINEALPNMVEKIQTKAYEQGKAEAVEYLVVNGYIKYGFKTEYLLNQMEKIKGEE